MHGSLVSNHLTPRTIAVIVNHKSQTSMHYLIENIILQLPSTVAYETESTTSVSIWKTPVTIEARVKWRIIIVVKSLSRLLIFDYLWLTKMCSECVWGGLKRVGGGTKGRYSPPPASSTTFSSPPFTISPFFVDPSTSTTLIVSAVSVASGCDGAEEEERPAVSALRKEGSTPGIWPKFCSSSCDQKAYKK